MVGDPIAVRYVRSDPKRSQLEATVSEFYVWAVFTPFAAIVGAGLFWRGICGLRWVSEQIWLVRYGNAVPGRITQVRVELRGRRNRSRISVLGYEFLTNETVRCTLELLGKPELNWRAGQDIVALLSPTRPNDHALDVFDARAVDRERLRPGRPG